MRQIVILLLMFAAAAPAGATAQAPDLIKIDGKVLALNSNPLRTYLDQHPGRLPESAVVSTGLWRGYVATFAIHQNRLVVEDVQIPTDAYSDWDAPETTRFRSVKKELFGDAETPEVTWFTGHLIVPTGELVEYVHMGYASVYSAYTVVKVVEGAVIELRKMNHAQFEEFRRLQFQAYKRTPEYAAALAETQKGEHEMSRQEAEQFIFQYASEEYMSRVYTTRAK